MRIPSLPTEKFHGLTCKGCRLYVVLVLEGHIFSRAIFWYVFCFQATFDQGQSSRYPFWRNWSKLGNVKGNGWQHACYMLSKKSCGWYRYINMTPPKSASHILMLVICIPRVLADRGAEWPPCGCWLVEVGCAAGFWTSEVLPRTWIGQ
jgi:hypothetical protein